MNNKIIKYLINTNKYKLNIFHPKNVYIRKEYFLFKINLVILSLP